MSEFTYLFRGRDYATSPAELEKSKQKWAAWFKDLGAGGHVKYAGHPLEGTGKVVNGKGKSVRDGSYATANEMVGGYMLVEARDLAHAVELSKGCPILEIGGSVEVRPVQNLGM